MLSPSNGWATVRCEAFLLRSAHLLCCEVIGSHVYAARSVLVALFPNEAVCMDARGFGVCHQLHLDPSMTHIVTHLKSDTKRMSNTMHPFNYLRTSHLFPAVPLGIIWETTGRYQSFRQVCVQLVTLTVGYVLLFLSLDAPGRPPWDGPSHS